MKKRLFLPFVIWLILVVILRVAIHDFGLLHTLRISSVEKMMESEKCTDTMDEYFNAFFEGLDVDVKNIYSDMNETDREAFREMLAGYMSLDTFMYLLSVTNNEKVVPHFFNEQQQGQLLEWFQDASTNG